MGPLEFLNNRTLTKSKMKLFCILACSVAAAPNRRNRRQYSGATNTGAASTSSDQVPPWVNPNGEYQQPPVDSQVAPWVNTNEAPQVQPWVNPNGEYQVPSVDNQVAPWVNPNGEYQVPSGTDQVAPWVNSNEAAQV